MDPVFLPRTFLRLERLPRNDNGKLRAVDARPAYADSQAGPISRATLAAPPEPGHAAADAGAAA